MRLKEASNDHLDIHEAHLDIQQKDGDNLTGAFPSPKQEFTVSKIQLTKNASSITYC